MPAGDSVKIVPLLPPKRPESRPRRGVARSASAPPSASLRYRCVLYGRCCGFDRGRVGSASGVFGGSGNAAAGGFGRDAAETCTTAAAGVRAFLWRCVFCVLMPPRSGHVAHPVYSQNGHTRHFCSRLVRVFAHHGDKVIILRYFATLLRYAKITAFIVAFLRADIAKR